MKGISLIFDNDGNADVAQARPPEECFGMALCPHCEHRPYQLWCLLKDCRVTDFKERCPDGRWAKMAVPPGWQNLSPEEKVYE